MWRVARMLSLLPAGMGRPRGGGFRGRRPAVWVQRRVLRWRRPRRRAWFLVWIDAIWWEGSGVFKQRDISSA